MALKAPSEASRRFAWGIPPELAPIASRRAMRLLLEAAGGRACAGVVDAHPAASPPVRAALPGRRLTQVLGVEIPAEKVVSTLRSLGFSVRVDPPGDYSVEVPYWRRDVRLADDIIEEVARVVGYDQIPAAGLEGRVPPRVPQPLRELRERTKDILVTAGMQEVITYPLVQRSTLESVIEPSVLASQEPLAVVNPLNAGEDRLRTSLRASILSVVAANQRHRDAQVAVFEASRIYLPRRGDLPREVEVLTGAVSGNRLDRWGQPSDEECDFFDMKAYVDRLFERLGLEVRFRSGSEFGMVPGRTALLEVGNRRVGVAGQIDPRLAARFEVRRDVFLFEMALDEVLSVAAERRAYQPLSRFPPVVEDLAVVVRRELPAEEVRAAILRHPLVVAAVLFDEYEGAPVAAGRKSLAFSITYQASDRTLTEAEVGRARSTILEGLSRELDAELRS
jgi:phenylalanyl-tRNA synthetase beta chain